MSTLLTIADVRAQMATALPDPQLQTILDREEADLLQRCGEPGDGETWITELVTREGTSLFLRKPIADVQSVTPRGATTALSPDTLDVSPGQGRIVLSGAASGRYTVVYAPVDERPRYQQALIDLLRLTVSRTALKSESIAGEYSYSAGDWDTERGTIYRRLGFREV